MQLGMPVEGRTTDRRAADPRRGGAILGDDVSRDTGRRLFLRLDGP